MPEQFDDFQAGGALGLLEVLMISVAETICGRYRPSKTSIEWI